MKKKIIDGLVPSIPVISFLIIVLFSLPGQSNAQAEIYTMRNLTLDTQGKTLLLFDWDSDREGRLKEYSNGVKVKDWKIKYEKKGHSRGSCDPPMLNLSFDKADSQGNPRELFNGVSTYSNHKELQYQKIRLIPECDIWNDYFLGGGSAGFGGQLTPNLREFAIHKIFRKFGIPVADVIGLANVTFGSTDSAYNGQTFRYMIIQRPTELDDQIPFTTQFNLNPFVYESEGTNGWTSDYSRLKRLQSAVVVNSSTGVERSLSFDRDTTLTFLLMTDFLNLQDMGPLHNEEWGVDKTTGRTKIIPHGFDASFGCYLSDPQYNEAQRLINEIDNKSTLQRAYYNLARDIFLKPSSLNDMLSLIDIFPYPDTDKEKLKEYLRIRFYQYATYFSSNGFADAMGQSYQQSNIQLPFVSEEEYLSRLLDFQNSCNPVRSALTGVTLNMVERSLSDLGVTFTIDVNTSDKALQIIKSRFSNPFRMNMVGLRSDNKKNLWGTYSTVSGVEDYAGPYYVIPPNTRARFEIHADINEDNFLQDTYYVEIDAFQPNNSVTEIKLNGIKTLSRQLGNAEPITIISPESESIMISGSTTTISWLGNLGKKVHVDVIGQFSGWWVLSDPNEWDKIYEDNKYIWTVGSVYRYEYPTGWVNTSLPPGRYKISVRNLSADINGESGYFNISPSENEVSPSVTISGVPTLSLTYSGSNEVELVSTFRIRLSAGDRDQTIRKDYAFNSYITTSSGLSIGGASTYSRPENVIERDYDYVIQAGTTAEFTVNTSFNPKIMFAGNYHAIIDRVYLGDLSGFGLVPVQINSVNVTNSIVIIGEVSPYINSINPESSASNRTVTINGVRFSSKNITLNLRSRTGGQTYSKVIQGTNSGKEIRFVPNVPVGRYDAQVIDPDTGGSNVMQIDITAPEEIVVPHSLKPPRTTINSGDTITVEFGFPPDIISSRLYMACPAGLRITFIELGDICNRWIPLNGTSNISLRQPFKATNSSSSVLKAVPNFYIYKITSPDFGHGVTSEITVNPPKIIPTPTIITTPTSSAIATPLYSPTPSIYTSPSPTYSPSIYITPSPTYSQSSSPSPTQTSSPSPTYTPSPSSTTSSSPSPTSTLPSESSSPSPSYTESSSPSGSSSPSNSSSPSGSNGASLGSYNAFAAVIQGLGDILDRLIFRGY